MRNRYRPRPKQKSAFMTGVGIGCGMYTTLFILGCFAIGAVIIGGILLWPRPY